jgi:hypothetical protein
MSCVLVAFTCRIQFFGVEGTLTFWIESGVDATLSPKWVALYKTLFDELY